jgi:flavin reductase (DIM6/NTAB) family NADH-FMN oxidoreductase RutF
MTGYHSYSPADGHGLKFNPFKALIAPRPIGWFTTLSAAGRLNLAPYSYFNAFSDEPPIIGFSSSGWKHSVRNAAETGEFVHNLVPRKLAEAMNQTSGAYADGVAETEVAGLETVPSDLVAPPRIAGGVAALECKTIEVKQLADAAGQKLDCYLALGEVVRVHIDTAYIRDGMVDEAALQLVARLGYRNYTTVDDVFAMERPEV